MFQNSKIAFFSYVFLFFHLNCWFDFPLHLKKTFALECDKSKAFFYSKNFVFYYLFSFIFIPVLFTREISLIFFLYILWRIYSPPVGHRRSCYGLRDFPFQTSTWSSRLRDYSAISSYCRDAKRARWSSMQVGERLFSLPPSLNLSHHLSLTIRPFPPPIFLFLTPVSP